jgi:DNA-binding PadR family transcriptional regulator
MSKENTTMFVILGLLTHEDMTGYDIKKRINASISNFWDAGYGQIYPSLKSLEKEGFVTRTAGGSGKGPERFVYSIAEPGRKKLLQWLKTANEKEYVRYEILLKLFFGSMLPARENIGKIEEFRNQSRQKLKLMELFSEDLQSVLEESKDHSYYYLTVLFGKYVYKAYLDWADEAIGILGKGEEEKP